MSKIEVKAQEIQKHDVIEPWGPVLSPVRVQDGYVFIDVRDADDGRGKIARSNRRWTGAIAVITREVDQVIEVDRNGDQA